MNKIILTLFLVFSFSNVFSFDIDIEARKREVEIQARKEQAAMNPKIPPELCEHIGMFIKNSLDVGYTVDETLDYLREKLKHSNKSDKSNCH